MHQDLLFVLLLLGAVVVMFALNRPRMDAVALIAMTALPLTGVITTQEALIGLSDPNVVLIAALFVIGEGLVRTGVAQRLGNLLVRRAGQDETRLIALLMAVVAVVGSVMSSTGVVALFIPAVLRMAREVKVPPGRLLMPLSVAALVSGMMTLIATAPNLVIQSELVRAGFEGFGFFSFTLFGAPILLAAIGVMLIARRWLVPETAATDAVEDPRPHLEEWIEEYGLAQRVFRVRITPRSPWAGRTLQEIDPRTEHGLNVLAIERPRRFAASIVEPGAQTTLRVDDVLFVHLRETETDLQALCERFGLLLLPLVGDYLSDRTQAVGMAELMIPVTSRLIGQTVISSRFRSLYKLSVIGIKRGHAPLAGRVENEPLRLGDTLLAAGPWRAIARLQSDPSELIVLNVPAERDDVIPLPTRAPYALGALAVVIALMVTGVVPNVLAALIGCLLLGLFRCIDMTGAYRAIQWPTLLLIVGMLPFSRALQNTGGVETAAQALLGTVGAAGPTAVLVALYILTVVLGLFISNTATAVLVAPVALAVAREMGLSPYPFAMTVALASSAAFLTPVSSPVNALVAGPGNYRFIDFVRIGVPLSLVVMGVSLVLVRLFLPFGS